MSITDFMFKPQSDKGYSVDVAPLVPTLKLSINLTVRLSRGTVVPPDLKMVQIIGIKSMSHFSYVDIHQYYMTDKCSNK